MTWLVLGVRELYSAMHISRDDVIDERTMRDKIGVATRDPRDGPSGAAPVAMTNTNSHRFLALAFTVLSACTVGDDAPSTSRGGDTTYPPNHPCTIEPTGEECFCSQNPQDPSCQQQPGGSDPSQPGGDPPGGDPCQIDPQGEACFCSQNPQDPYCQQAPTGPGGDPCQTDPQGEACYCSQNPQDPYCQQAPTGPGGDPCQTDPQGEACYCSQNPQDPYCE